MRYVRHFFSIMQQTLKQKMWINWEAEVFKNETEFLIGIPFKFFRQIFYKCFLCSFQLWSLSHLWSHSLITPRGASHLKLHPSWILYEMQITPFQICSASSRPLDFRLLWYRDECIRLLESTLIYTSSSNPTSYKRKSIEESRCPNFKLEFRIVVLKREDDLQGKRSSLKLLKTWNIISQIDINDWVILRNAALRKRGRSPSMSLYEARSSQHFEKLGKTTESRTCTRCKLSPFVHSRRHLSNKLQVQHNEGLN